MPYALLPSLPVLLFAAETRSPLLRAADEEVIVLDEPFFTFSDRQFVCIVADLHEYVADMCATCWLSGGLEARDMRAAGIVEAVLPGHSGWRLRQVQCTRPRVSF